MNGIRGNWMRIESKKRRMLSMKRSLPIVSCGRCALPMKAVCLAEPQRDSLTSQILPLPHHELESARRGFRAGSALVHGRHRSRGPEACRRPAAGAPVRKAYNRIPLVERGPRSDPPLRPGL